MAERRRRFDFNDESLGTEYGSELGFENLDCDFAVMLEVGGEIHRRHAPRTELALDSVTVGEGGAQAFRHQRSQLSTTTAGGSVRPSPEGTRNRNRFPSRATPHSEMFTSGTRIGD